MKKALIAGAASLTLAAMPVVGVFATDGTVGHGETLTDNFSFNINHECTFSRVLGSVTEQDQDGDGGHPTGATGGVNWNPTNTTADAIAITGVAGNAYSLGSSTFNVKCNGTNGYQVAAVITDLHTSVADDTITTGSTAITAGEFSGNASSWTVAKTGATPTYYLSTNNEGDANIVASSQIPTVNAGQVFTMEYAVALADGHPAGAYQGSVQYTLTDLTVQP